MRCVVLLLLAIVAGASEVPPAARSLADGLDQAFRAHLRDPVAYAAEVERTCRRFPEGDLFPYTMPVLA